MTIEYGLPLFFDTPFCTAAINAADARQAAVGQFGQLGGVRQRIFFQNRRERRQRMAGDVKTEQLLFVREQFVLRPFRQIADGFGHRRRFFLQRAEERALPFLLVGQNARRARQRAFDLREQRRARLAKAIARAGFDERFENFPVHRPAIHALAQIRKRREFAAFVPRLQNRFHGDFADAFDGGQAEADGCASAVPVPPARAGGAK